ncbi:hypothetical protein [Winogradskyella wichelsiae]|uniref:hypothetical protein n=1 Tax=Winogradskyella wichelsiae TaxID=2697007 RepID=UPI0015CA2F06|nr:hypothetical protein [Winogradskyella wichelsiae]
MSSSNILIVVGMHRSGTSLTSQWLNAIGLDLGDRLLGVDIGNNKGHFEDLDFIEFHDAVMARVGIGFGGLSNLKPFELNDYEIERLQSIINFKSNLRKQWGWKDPRTCLFLKHYRNLIPNAKYFIVLRNYENVINSLVKRDISVRKKELKLSQRSPSSRKVHELLYLNEKKYYQKSNQYAEVYCQYLEYILDHVKHMDEKNYIIVDIDNPNVKMSEFLNSNNFNIEMVEFDEVFDKNQVSSINANIINLINPNVISKIKTIENEIYAFQK